jgi:hypothetical protein
LIKAKKFGRTFGATKEKETHMLALLEKHISDFYSREIPQQNAGLAVNLTEQAVNKQIGRLVAAYEEASNANEGSRPSISRQVSDSSLKLMEETAVLTAEDFGVSNTPELGDSELKAKVEEDLAKMVGIEGVQRSFFEKMDSIIKYIETGGNIAILRTSLNMIITVSDTLLDPSPP